MDTKRKYDRKRETVLLDVYRAGAVEEKSRACLTDISIGGLGFESSSRFNMGDKVNLVFRIKEGKEYVLDGVIRRVARSAVTYSYGVQFIEMGFFAKFRLKKFVKGFLSKSG